MADDNKKAADELAAEREKLGFAKPKESAPKSELDEEEEENEELEDDEEVDEEDDSDDSDEEEDESEDSDDDSEEEDEEEDEDEDPDKKGRTHKVKTVPVKIYNKMRTELRDALSTIKDLTDTNKVLESKLPDDFDARVDALAKEIGIEDAAGLKKITGLMKDVIKGQTAGLEGKLAALEKQVAGVSQKSIVDEFPEDWRTFRGTLKSEFPNTSLDQMKECRKLMDNLSHNPKYGGKVYKDEKTGKDVLDPYPLDYIFFKHKDKFEELVAGKKSKGMEGNRSQGITTSKKKDGDIKGLDKNASAQDILKLDREYAGLEVGVNNLRAPEDSNI